MHSLLFSLVFGLLGGVWALRISQVQGTRWLSPYKGQTVTVEGVVTAIDANRGFYIQDTVSDNDNRTSEALFVFARNSDMVSLNPGDLVRVSGIVDEHKPREDETANSMTQLKATKIFAFEKAPVPRPVELGTGIPSETIYFSKVAAFDMDPINVEESNLELDMSRALDYFESMEGMLVTIPSPMAVSKTDRYGSFWVVPNRGKGYRNVNGRGGVTITGTKEGYLNMNPYRIKVAKPYDGKNSNEISLGDELETITGILEYSFGNWRVRPLTATKVTGNHKDRATKATVIESSDKDLTIVTYNVWNLNPKKSTIAAIGAQIAHELGEPDIVALQEIQDNNGPIDDGTVAADKTLGALCKAIQVAGGPEYGFVQVDPLNNHDGGQPGSNIRPAYLFRKDRVKLAPSLLGPAKPYDKQEAHFRDDKLILKYNPGRIDPSNPVFDRSRKPLSVMFEFNKETITIINHHAKSKLGSTPLFGNLQPSINAGSDSRVAQSQVMRLFVEDALRKDPNARIIVLGDFNEFQMNPSIQEMKRTGALVELIDRHIRPAEQYSYIYDGNCQLLDHIFVTPNLVKDSMMEPVHLNTFVKNWASDHDPLVASIRVVSQEKRSFGENPIDAALSRRKRVAYYRAFKGVPASKRIRVEAY